MVHGLVCLTALSFTKKSFLPILINGENKFVFCIVHKNLRSNLPYLQITILLLIFRIDNLLNILRV